MRLFASPCVQVLLRILLRFLRLDRSLKILFGGLQVVPHCDLYGIANPVASILYVVLVCQLRLSARSNVVAEFWPSNLIVSRDSAFRCWFFARPQNQHRPFIRACAKKTSRLV